jgi:hypothetical protein
MFSRSSVSLATAGALAITTIMFPAFGSAARDRSAVTTEFSAENQQKEKKEQNKENKQIQQQQHQNIQQQQKLQQQEIKQDKNTLHREKQQEKNTLHREMKQDNKVQKIENKELKFDAKNAKRREFTRSGNNAVVVGGKLRGGNGVAQFSMRGHNYSAWRGGGSWRHRGSDGRWETFVALGALGVLAIGAYEYYPYAYIDAPQPFCEGLTEDGCQLDFQDVQTMEGDVIGQCVAYCPWR